MDRELHRICSRLVAIEEERKQLADEAKEIKADAKASGYDAALITKAVRMMMLDGAKRAKALEQHELFDTYLSGVGLLAGLDEPAGDREAPPHTPPASSDPGQATHASDEVPAVRGVNDSGQSDERSPVTSGPGMSRETVARGGIMPPGNKSGKTAGPASDDDDPDIPAFLRRDENNVPAFKRPDWQEGAR